MLEVLLPFLCMKQRDEQKNNKFDLACVYAYFKRFVKSLIPNNLHTKFNSKGEQVLPYLKCCLNLMDMVFMYVDRELHTHLKKKGVIVEMFASSWVMTLFSRIADLHLIYEVWQIFLFERDQFFIFYFAVALIRL